MEQPTEFTSRTTLIGFVERTERNLLFVTDAQWNGQDVHAVTQIVLSLLGLIIFPYEHLKKAAPFRGVMYDELISEGWPSWSPIVGELRTLQYMLRRIRNAAAHHRIVYGGADADSRDPSQVTLIFSDRDKWAKEDSWRASIRADDLQKFVGLFARSLRNILD
jgi:hypothetical protein